MDTPRRARGTRGRPAREREARLFEHKLAAYSAYLLEENAARKLWVDAAARGERPPLGATGPLYDRGLSLQILGSARAATAEIEATRQTEALLQSDPGDERKRIAAGLGASLVELTNAIREDLEVQGEIFQAPTGRTTPDGTG